MRTILILSGIVLFSFFAASQPIRDFQFWQKADVEFNLGRFYDAGISAETRITGNSAHFSYYYLDFGNYFRLTKKIRLALDLLYVNKKADESDSQRYQYNASLTYREKIHRFVFYNRILHEAQLVDPGKPGGSGSLHDKYLRDKVTLRYKIKKWLYPYAEDEVYYRLQAESKNNPAGFNRNRFYAGTLFYLTNTSRIELFYLHENNFHIKQPSINDICGIGFSHSFF